MTNVALPIDRECPFTGGEWPVRSDFRFWDGTSISAGAAADLSRSIAGFGWTLMALAEKPVEAAN